MNIRIRNWEKFQHRDAMRSDLTPPWIKGYTRQLSDEDYLDLSFHQRGVLESLRLERARAGRDLPGSTAKLTRRLGQRVTTRDLEALNQAGFIEFVPAECQHDAGLEPNLTEPNLTPPAAPAPAKPRKQDHLWEALVTAMGRDPGTSIERKRWNAALKELREAGAQPDDIKARAAAYRKVWPRMDLTPTGLAANWSRFDTAEISPRLAALKAIHAERGVA